MRDDSNVRRERLIFIVLCLCLLIGGFLVGWLDPTAIHQQLATGLKQLKDSMVGYRGDNWVHQFGLLFFHNAFSASELVLFGFLFGIFPVYAIWFNGLVAGYVVGESAKAGVHVWQVITYGLLPHGIFELSAIIWAAAIGMSNGLAVIRRIQQWVVRLRSNGRDALEVRSNRGASNRASIRSALAASMRRLPIIWGILLVAALIESALTPHIMAWGIPALKHHF